MGFRPEINAETVSATIAIGAIITWLGERFGGSSSAPPLATFTHHNMVFPSKQDLFLTGEAVVTSFLYIFFATAGGPGLSIAESVSIISAHTIVHR